MTANSAHEKVKDAEAVLDIMDAVLALADDQGMTKLTIQVSTLRAVSGMLRQYGKAILDVADLRDFVADIRDHGLRTDLTPTVLEQRVDARSEYTWWSEYVHRAESNLQDRAVSALTRASRVIDNYREQS